MRWIIEISKTVSKQDEEGNWDNCHQDFGIISTEEYGSMREVVSYLRDRNVWYKEFGEYSYSIRENQDADDDELGDFLADYEIRIYRKDQIMIDLMV